MTLDATRCIELLGLQPHPEGGFYREIHRSSQQIRAGTRERAASTAIYYLLPEGAFSAWHVVQSDEQWHHYAGAPLEHHLLENGDHECVTLGAEIFDGQFVQATVPAGVIQAARAIGGAALMGCTVAPGFDFADFALLGADELYRGFPAHRATIDLFLAPPGTTPS
jgi:predicted cupin superfamily sugar epimerase